MESGFSVNNKVLNISPLRANPTEWSNTLKQLVGKLPTNCLSVFDHFVILALKGLNKEVSITSRKLIIDHMNSGILLSLFSLITNPVEIGEMNQDLPRLQVVIIDKKIEDVNNTIADSIEISENFHAEFLRLSGEAEKKKNFELLSKGIALKREFQEKLNQANKLGEVLQVLQEKRKTDHLKKNCRKTCEKYA